MSGERPRKILGDLMHHKIPSSFHYSEQNETNAI
jgi:hypothetical protein